MNRLSRLLRPITLLGSLALTCSRAPDASPALTVAFTSEATPALDYPVDVRFVNRSDSTGIAQWDFGNGRTSAQFSPVVRYDSSGSFPVWLTIRRGSESGSVVSRVDVPYRRLSVAVLYVVPKERSFDPVLLTAIEKAMPVVQAWYNQQLNGRTYALNRPTVDTIRSSRYGYEYGTTSIDLLNGLSQEVYGKAGPRINPNEQVLLLFYPVGIAGAEGVGVADRPNGTDRRVGIIGADACQSLTRPTAAEQSLGLWTTAHELGHALALAHNLIPNALMFGPVENGGKVPDVPRPVFPTCQLIPADKAILSTNPFLR